MNISTIGLDLAKKMFQVHGVDPRGKVVLQRAIKREELAEFFAQLPPCLVGMEACATAHYWGRKLQGMGRTVRLMAPRFVKPYLTGEKNDANDAAAICEAVTRPSMRFVPLKSAEQQALLVLHRTRAAPGRCSRTNARINPVMYRAARATSPYRRTLAHNPIYRSPLRLLRLS